MDNNYEQMTVQFTKDFSNINHFDKKLLRQFVQTYVKSGRNRSYVEGMYQQNFNAVIKSNAVKIFQRYIGSTHEDMLIGQFL